jgi:hypothetical protein
MSLDPAIFRALVANGATPEMLLAVVEASAAVDEARKESKRANNSERQSRFRERNNASNALLAVTECDGVTPPPLLDKKETSPTPPKEKINHSPRVCIALTRKAGGFGPPEGVELASWNAFAKQRRKPIGEVAYARICKTLDESRESGWPPGELIDTATERGWETIFTPTEAPKAPRNGQSNFQPSGGIRGSRPDPAFDMWRDACNDIAAEGFKPNPQDRGGDWLSLPAIGAS